MEEKLSTHEYLSQYDCIVIVRFRQFKDSEDLLKSVLQQALVDSGRVTELCIVDRGEFGKKNMETVVLGMRMVQDPLEAFRDVDMGPDISGGDMIAKQQSNAFREFWGELTELRRFGDGSIKETVTWNHDKYPAQVLQNITKHVLTRKFANILSLYCISFGFPPR